MNLKPEDFSYPLSDDKIAGFPVSPRHASKLIVYKNKEIIHDQFLNLDCHLPVDSLLIFNDTKVIQARLLFRKKTGAKIEIFCLEPQMLQLEIPQLLKMKNEILWKCLIGNRKKWKDDEILELTSDYNGQSITLTASMEQKADHENIVRFSWNGSISFLEILSLFGKIPLPPYLKREVSQSDKVDYQTLYAMHNGAVAAPTAGLHFTEDVFKRLDEKNLKKEFITLHVSAGTFKPLSSQQIQQHKMHEEQISFSYESVKNIRHHKGKIICTGTTSLRAMESLYYYACMLMNDADASFEIAQSTHSDFIKKEAIDKNEALDIILQYMEKKELEFITGTTRIFIYPPYKFHLCDGLITNFHLPQSTLLLLIAAFAPGGWELIYEEALKNNYRFLSYGDASLILP